MKGKGATKDGQAATGRQEDEQRAPKGVEALGVVASSADSVLELDQVLEKALVRLMKVSRAEVGAIHLVDAENQEVVLRLQQGDDSQYYARRNQKEGAVHGSQDHGDERKEEHGEREGEQHEGIHIALRIGDVLGDCFARHLHAAAEAVPRCVGNLRAAVQALQIITTPATRSSETRLARGRSYRSVWSYT